MCLGLGKVLKKRCEHKEDIFMIFEIKDVACDFSTKIKDAEEVCDSAFVTDIMQKMNVLDSKLQGKAIFGIALFVEIKSLQTKLRLFTKQLSDQTLLSSPFRNNSLLNFDFPRVA